MTEPLFTVVMATWNRGRHILPSIRSVLEQDVPDFELLVIGDACTDDTADIVAGVDDKRIRFINLDTRWRTQSGPNNRGNDEARGRYIAYIGHDDIWSPDHLTRLVTTFEQTRAGLVTSGLLMYWPPPETKVALMGIGTPDWLASVFTPPSALAHRRQVWEQIGGWLPRDQARGPVDLDFELRAAEAGFAFHSTGAVTVHKFAASHRYLCAILPQSDEQEAMLQRLQARDQSWLAAAQARAVVVGTDLVRHGTEEVRFRTTAVNDRNRGLSGGDLRALGPGAVVPQDAGERVGQWLPYQAQDGGIRYTIAGVTANMLVPVSHAGAVKMVLDLVFPRWGWPRGLVVRLNGGELRLNRRPSPWLGRNAWRITAKGTLKPDGPSVLTVIAPAHLTLGDKGVGVGALRLAPAN